MRSKILQRNVMITISLIYTITTTESYYGVIIKTWLLAAIFIRNWGVSIRHHRRSTLLAFKVPVTRTFKAILIS